MDKICYKVLVPKRYLVQVVIFCDELYIPNCDKEQNDD